MTPSGLSMGTILKTYLSLNDLAAGSSETRNSSKPSTTKELLLSPGCTRPVSTIHFLFAIAS